MVIPNEVATLLGPHVDLFSHPQYPHYDPKIAPVGRFPINTIGTIVSLSPSEASAYLITSGGMGWAPVAFLKVFIKAEGGKDG